MTLLFPTYGGSDNDVSRENATTSATTTMAPVASTTTANTADPTVTAAINNSHNDNISATKSSKIVNSSVFVGLNVTTVQDILSNLGKPSRIFYKEEDKMKIHSITENNTTLLSNSHPLESKSGDTLVVTGTDDKDKGRR